jgi:hypothetical protein
MRLTEYERDVHRAVFDSLLPGIPGGAPAARDCDLIGAHERMLTDMPRPHALGFRGAFVGVQLVLPLAMLGRPTTFTRLDAEARERALERLAKHRGYLLRQLALLLKTAASFAYFQMPSVRAHFGLPPVADPGVPAMAVRVA